MVQVVYDPLQIPLLKTLALMPLPAPWCLGTCNFIECVTPPGITSDLNPTSSSQGFDGDRKGRLPEEANAGCQQHGACHQEANVTMEGVEVRIQHSLHPI